MEKIKLSIIIVSHNNLDLFPSLFKTLTSAIKYLNKKTEVIVVDNNSDDNSSGYIEKNYPSVKLFKNKVNLGYAKANNIALRSAKGEYILLLNSDTILENDSLSKIFNFMEEYPEVGVATCRVVMSDGSLDPACHRGFPTPWAAFTYYFGLEKLFPENPFFSKYHLYYQPLGVVHEIDSPSGAFYFARKKAVESVNYFDEDYFMYGEDIDLSFRIKQKGWKIMFFPKCRITHLKRKSGFKNINREIRVATIKAFYNSMKIFYNKHYEKLYLKSVKKLIFFIIDVKMQLDLLKS